MMFWFKRKEYKQPEEIQSDIVELEAAKKAQIRAFDEAEKEVKKLNRLLVENGFTPKIYIATGGKVKRGHN